MSEATVRELEAFYGGYLDAFNRDDADAFARAFSYPNAMLTATHGMLLQANESETKAFLQGAIAALHARGWERSGVDRLQIWPFSDEMAMVIADITRYAGDGAVFDQGRACYMVRREGGDWKIVTFTEMKPPFSEATVQIG
ncbi:MAG: hypothetical protein QOG53_642 [Frankiales bacterium]|jgi:ketosteroid isomerase-like protein|nr:hypothetical protein [Frankiales bacterium]